MTKDIGEFWKAPARYDGLRSYCKKCSSAENRKNRVYFAKYNRERYKNDEKFRDSVKLKTVKRTKKMGDVYVVVCEAVKNGIIKRGRCIICKSSKVHGHHKDYNKKLDVIWLCPLHHRRVHLGEIAV